jgi:hypothetical protein
MREALDMVGALHPYRLAIEPDMDVMRDCRLN